MVSDHQDFTHKMTKDEGQTLRVPLNVPQDFRDGAPTVTIETHSLPRILLFEHEIELSESDEYTLVVYFDSQYLADDAEFIGGLICTARFGEYEARTSVTVIRHDRPPSLTIEALGLPSTLTPQVELQDLETGTILRFAIDAIPYAIPSGRYRLFVPYIAHENMYFGVDSPFSALTISKDAPLSLVLEYTIQ